MFLLDGNPLAVDTAFTHNDISYPANWLRLSTAEEKAAIGITEVADPVRADDRFYWNGDINNPKALEDKEEVDQNGNPLFVQVLGEVDGRPVMVNSDKRLITKGLKSNFVAQVKASAGSLLSATDWKVIRAAETGTTVDADTLEKRSAVRAKSNELEAAINAITTVEELIALDLSFPKQD